MTFGSLFAGIGGIDLGLERAGLECRWQIESDPFCRKVLAKHWPEIKRYGDIRTIDGRELEWVDCIAGGFPCQDLSQAGKRAGIEGDRSGLWFEMARLIGELRPRYVLIENVPGLLDYRAMPRVLGELARLGYVGSWTSLRASDFGAAHLRHRIFIVAYRSGERRRENPGGPSSDETADGRTRWNGSRPNRDHIAVGESPELADAAGPSGEPSELGGRLTHGHDAELGDASSIGTRSRLRACVEIQGLRRKRFGETDSTLEHSPRDVEQGRVREDRRMRRRGVCETGEPVADTGNGLIPLSGQRTERRDGSRSASEDVPDALDAGLPDAERTQLSGTLGNDEGRAAIEFRRAFAPGPNDPLWGDILRERPDLAPAIEKAAQSSLCRVSDGLSDRLDRALEQAMSGRTKRLRALGNAVVPQCAEWIAKRILEFNSRLEL